jgi:hypothetical protein
MSTRPEQEKSQDARPEEKSAWIPPRLETVPLREAMGGGGGPYFADSITFYS